MGFKLKEVIPWGRTFKEYLAMFDLSQDDLRNKKILGCGDGPASFNAEATALGMDVISCDPIYAYDEAEIREQINATYTLVMAELNLNVDGFLWTTFKTPDDLGAARMRAMQRFLQDYAVGQREGRYQIASLPNLPYSDGEFGLTLVSHFLFLYSDQFPLQFHIDSVLELCRVADEVRVFPLNTLGSSLLSPHLEPTMRHLRQVGYHAEQLSVPYEMQKGANTMLRITPAR
jgi:hypothetical protein